MREAAQYHEAVREYLLIALSLGELADGFVDCWYGDPHLSERAAAEGPVNPADLAARADRLRSRLPDTDLSQSRRGFLDVHLAAMACTARRLAGEPIPFRDEVRTCFGVDPEPGDPDRYADVHRAISRLLPGSGGLRRRIEEFYARNLVPPDRFGRAVRAVSDQLRARAVPAFGLPAEEQVEYQIVHDKPWNAFNRYLGGFRSAVALDAEAGGTIAALPLIPAHESYPGHHTEHCRKEAVLVDQLGCDEHTVAVVNTPQCLVAEGTAELGARVLLGTGWGEWTAELLAAEGITIDGALVEAVVDLVRQLLPARQDAAVLLHDRGADPDQVTGYLERWLLLPADRAARLARFAADPLWRAYSVTYPEGSRLVAAWLAARPPEVTLAERFQVLLDEAVLPSRLTAEATEAGRSPVSPSPVRR
ncbi:DUF885 domain-containing protein [Amycolatopsis nivea]